MTKRMRQLQAEIVEQKELVKGFMSDGEGRDLEKAEAALNKIDELQKEFDLEKRAEDAEKAGVVIDDGAPGKSDGFKVMAKMVNHQRLDDTEKALISGGNSESGENDLVPEDVKTEINELRKTYVSARDLVTVVSTQSLSGSVNYESGAPAGLTAFDDGDVIAEETNPTFVQKKFSIGWYGKIIPISRILLGAEKADLMSYINRWFVRNAVLTENAQIFETLKAGYNSGVPKVIAGWKAFKKSIHVDLDPSCRVDGVIATNQSGFACLDAEEDKDGKPILQENPAYPTQKLFQGLPVKVYPDVLLPNIDETHFPVIYGATKAGCTFVEHQSLEFFTSEHALANKNQNMLRVIEGFDVMSTDTSAYIYGSFSASV